tara:strand:- start:42758 stop:42934 length:177 start_codon:yes stop_codon:yes gene_type:complete
MVALWLDNRQAIAPDASIFRSELKTPLLLKPLAHSVGNVRNKDPQTLVGVGEKIVLPR